MENKARRHAIMCKAIAAHDAQRNDDLKVMICKLREKYVVSAKKQLKVILDPELIPCFVQGSKDRASNHTLFGSGSRGDLNGLVNVNNIIERNIPCQGAPCQSPSCTES